MVKYFYIIYSFVFHLYYLAILKLIILFSVRKSIQSQNRKKKTNNKKICVFGSSQSLLKISDSEKKIISRLPKVFMNRNLIYWRKLDIWPEYYFLLDTPMKSRVSGKIFIETLKMIEKNKKKTSPILLLENFYKFLTPKTYKTIFFNHRKSSNLNWANNKMETLFGHHGSLTSLINVLSILNYKKILILGVDLNSTGYFFNTKNVLTKNIDQRSNREEKKYKIHSNLIMKNNKNILTHWNLIDKNIKKKKIKLYCGSKNSLFVRKGLINHLSVKNFYNLK